MTKRTFTISVFVALVLAACGGGDDGASSGTSQNDDTAGGSDGGTVVNQQPPGQAIAEVDGLEFTLTDPGALACNIESDTITFSFRIGDNEITLGAGANLYDTGWLGSIDLRVANPDSGPGPVTYFPSLADNGDGIAIEGNSMSYVGPMQMQPPNDGSNPPPIDAGSGTISVTCP